MMTSSEISLSEKIAPHFYPVHKAIRGGTHDKFLLKGGRNSTKSSFVAIQIILGIIIDPDANAVAFRKVGAGIRDSVQGTILWAIDALDQAQNFRSINSPHEITYLPTGQKILLRGLDKPSKIKSIRLRKGYFKYLWFEEADEYAGDEEIRSVEQSVLRGPEKKKFVEFLTYNPPRNPEHWINKLAGRNPEDKFIHHSTYLDIPRSWISDIAMRELLRLKENNYEAYAHEYLGEPIGNPKEIIFSGKYIERDFETPPTDQIYQNRFFFGADWGFAADPTTLIRCFIKDDYLFIDYEAYGMHTELDDIPALFDTVPLSRKYRIYGDSARPETISHVAKRGFQIFSVKKSKKVTTPDKVGTEKGFVEDGIEYLRSFKKIIIHTRCKNTIEEFKRYKYKIDRNDGTILPEIEDKYNHCIDAIRYALSDYVRKRISWASIL